MVEPEGDGDLARQGPSHAASGEKEGEDTEVVECVGVPARKFPYALCAAFARLTCIQCGIEQFETRDLRWAPDGKGMILLDRETFCCAFEVEEEGQ